MSLYGSEIETLGAWETASLVYTDSQYLCPTERSATPLGSQATLESARHEPIHHVTAADDLGRVQERRAEPELLHCCQHLLWDGRT